jgi:hypothetical protein
MVPGDVHMMMNWSKGACSGDFDGPAYVEVAELPQMAGIGGLEDPNGGHLAVMGVVFAALVRRIKEGPQGRG